jgi:hypothetical protein
MLQIDASLTDDSRGVINDRLTFIVQVTGVNVINKLWLQFTAVAKLVWA